MTPPCPKCNGNNVPTPDPNVHNAHGSGNQPPRYHVDCPDCGAYLLGRGIEPWTVDERPADE